MRVFIRKTLNGIEYWDNVEKRTILIPTGAKPDFEVTENPKSMLLVSDEDEVNERTEINLDEMKVDQLLAYAKKKNIDIPGNMKKENTIRNHIAEQLAADAE